MKRVYLIIIILFPFQSLAQETNGSFQYFANGNIKSVTKQIDNNIREYIEYFPNGHTKDSIRFKDDIPVGIRTIYHDNGNLKFLIQFNKGDDGFEFERYRSNGTLKLTGGRHNNKSFGQHKLYNQKKQVIRFQDMNKGKAVTVPYKYRNSRHLIGSGFENKFKFDKANLHKDNGSRKIKSGALISVTLKTDSSVKQHYQIEGFSADSIFISCFSYDLSENKKTLKFDSTLTLGLNEIETIFFAKNNSDLAELAAMTVSIVGVVWFLDPLILVPILQGFGALLEPVTIGFILSGPPLFIWGRHLYKMIVPRQYRLAEWKLSVQK